MSTIDPQLIHMLFTGALYLITAGGIVYVFNELRKISRETPSTRLVNELRRETEHFSGQVADLEERFTRFQKREGMRHARETKQTDRDLAAEAAALVAQGGAASDAQGPTGIKGELYRKLRGH